jgi:hypothetical protein
MATGSTRSHPPGENFVRPPQPALCLPHTLQALFHVWRRIILWRRRTGHQRLLLFSFQRCTVPQLTSSGPRQERPGIFREIPGRITAGQLLEQRSRSCVALIGGATHEEGKWMTNILQLRRRKTAAQSRSGVRSRKVAAVERRRSSLLSTSPATRRGISFGIGLALAAGWLAVTASPASAARCGLSYSGPVFGQYTYTIRNCHSHGVRRKLDLRKFVVGYPDGPCHYIPAQSSIRDWISIPDSVYIAGMKRC